jgi:hypothetical protein
MESFSSAIKNQLSFNKMSDFSADIICSHG